MALVARQSISVILPCYNEEENIEKALEQAINNLDLLFSDWEIIVVDDGSHDGTGDIVNRVVSENARVSAVRHPRNQGYGGALRSGIQKARKELVFFCDSDLQFHLNEILLLLTWVEQYDIVIGYRRKRRDPFYRKLNAWGWNLLVRLLLGLKVRDIDCAFKLFRNEVFNVIRIDAVGAMVNTEILVQATRLGYKVREVPVTHFPRLNGRQTGARVQVIVKAFKELFRLYRRLGCIEPIVFPSDQRSDRSRFHGMNRRKGERRKAMLPINFRNRRKQIFEIPDASPRPITQSGRSVIASTSALAKAGPSEERSRKTLTVGNRIKTSSYPRR